MECHGQRGEAASSPSRVSAKHASEWLLTRVFHVCARAGMTALDYGRKAVAESRTEDQRADALEVLRVLSAAHARRRLRKVAAYAWRETRCRRIGLVARRFSELLLLTFDEIQYRPGGRGEQRCVHGIEAAAALHASCADATALAALRHQYTDAAAVSLRDAGAGRASRRCAPAPPRPGRRTRRSGSVRGFSTSRRRRTPERRRPASRQKSPPSGRRRRCGPPSPLAMAARGCGVCSSRRSVALARSCV